MTSRMERRFQIGLRLGGEVQTNPRLLEQVGRLLRECDVCGMQVIGFGATSGALALAELGFSNSVPVAWLASAELEPIPRIQGLTIVTVPGGAAELIEAANRSVDVVVICGANAEGGLADKLRCVEIGTLFAAAQCPTCESKEFLALPELLKSFQDVFVDTVVDEAMSAGYELLWSGYPTSDEDARTTWSAMGMFRRAILAGVGGTASGMREQEAVVRLHEAAGLYHYYQKADYSVALRHFAQGALKSNQETETGRFIRALALETIGLLAFDLEDYSIAECAARQAREAYIRSREDSAPEAWFYFDHTIEGLAGDAEVYRAYGFAKDGLSHEASAALANARISYKRALSIQPLWQSNKTSDTYANAVDAIEALEAQLQLRRET